MCEKSSKGRRGQETVRGRRGPCEKGAIERGQRGGEGSGCALACYLSFA